MISIEQLNGEIALLEEETPTHVIMQKLANLYVIRDHMMTLPNNVPVTPPSVIPHFGNSEFATKIEGKDISSILSLIDEVMSTVSVVNPNLYNSVIRRL
jgi:hypothetical protein